MTQPLNEIQSVLEYWFGPVQKLGLAGIDSPMELWFGGTEEIDRDIDQRFRPLMDRAVLGGLEAWMQTPAGALALIILLDQFSLNVFRDLPRSFTQAHRALPYALTAIRKGFDREVPFARRFFFYMPLEHAEDIHLQNECIKLFETAVAEAPLDQRGAYESGLDFAKRHHRVIAKFGRYPDRNPILGRESTPDEAKYLAEGGPDF